MELPSPQGAQQARGWYEGPPIASVEHVKPAPKTAQAFIHQASVGAQGAILGDALFQRHIAKDAGLTAPEAFKSRVVASMARRRHS